MTVTRQYRSPSTSAGSSPSPSKTVELPDVIQKIQHLLDSGRAKEALELATGRSSGSPMFQNARAVCLMRVGKGEEALQALRQAMIVGGGTTFRDNVPEIYRANFATAMAMSGHVVGALRLLNEIQQDELPQVQSLRAAISRWEKSLGFATWLQWKLGVEVSQSVPLDFPPGVIG